MASVRGQQAAVLRSIIWARLAARSIDELASAVPWPHQGIVAPLLPSVKGRSVQEQIPWRQSIRSYTTCDRRVPGINDFIETHALLSCWAAREQGGRRDLLRTLVVKKLLASEEGWRCGIDMCHDEYGVASRKRPTTTKAIFPWHLATRPFLGSPPAAGLGLIGCLPTGTFQPSPPSTVGSASGPAFPSGSILTLAICQRRKTVVRVHGWVFFFSSPCFTMYFVSLFLRHVYSFYPFTSFAMYIGR